MARAGLLGFLMDVASGDDRVESHWPRPPGALPEAMFLSRCTRCSDCIDACPHDAIGKIPEDGGRWAGTPAMNPAAKPCHLCEDTPCVAACEPRALVPVAAEDILLGTAMIDRGKCFAYLGPECGACELACPRDAVVTVGGKPTIDPAACNGCGLCREACPVWGKAIRVLF